jgi:cobalt-precorrin 5A hydrolase
MIAIGIGCRRGASAQAILDTIAAARAGIPATEDIVLCSGELKSAEDGLIRAAEQLGARLVLLSMAALREADHRCATRSAASMAATGLGSMAEAAALAAAGPGAKLIVPRLAGKGVTCAIAAHPDVTETRLT